MNNSEWNSHVNALLYRIQENDKRALQTLYNLTSAKILGIISRIIVDTSEAEDVLQEVFIKLWQQANQYHHNGSAWAWVCVLTRNSTLDRLRKLKSHPHISTDEDNGLLDSLIHEYDQPTNIDLNRCLYTLTKQARKSVLLSYLHGYSHSELSIKMSVPLGTMKAWIRRGLQELKLCLDT